MKYTGPNTLSYLVQTIKNTFANISHTHTKSEITDFPTIPTKTSQLENDSGFKTTDNDILMTGATTDTDGSAGYVPAPTAGSANRYLRSDGTWVVPPDTDTTYTLFSIAGTLAITKGGTGSTTALTARTNLGAISLISSTSEPANANQNVGDLWFYEC